MTCPKCAIPLTIDHQYAYCGSCGYEALDYKPTAETETGPRWVRGRYNRAYYQAHRERLIAEMAVFRQTHREEIRAYDKEYYWAHRERVLENQRASRARKRAQA